MFAQLEIKSAQPEVKLNLWRSIYLILDFSWNWEAQENVGIKKNKKKKKDAFQFHSYIFSGQLFSFLYTASCTVYSTWGFQDYCLNNDGLPNCTKFKLKNISSLVMFLKSFQNQFWRAF